MNNVLLIIQFVLVAIICICVLMQKSSSMGLGAYSGSNESLFGAKGPAGFLAKFTFIIAILFVINTVALGYSYNKATQKSVFDDVSSTILPQNVNELKRGKDVKENIEENQNTSTTGESNAK